MLLTLCMLLVGTVSRFCCCLLTFFKINFFKKLFHEHYQSNCLESVGPDLRKRLQRLSADDKMPLLAKKKIFDLGDNCIQNFHLGRYIV